MNHYPLPPSDLHVSRLAYGCMGLSGWDDAPVNAEETRRALELLDIALEAGVTLFDHADIYAHGKAERVFSALWEAVPGVRERVVVQSKCGIHLPDRAAGKVGRYDFRYEHIVRSVEGSLERLGTDHLDLLLLHRPDALIEPDEVSRAFDHLLGEGMVRHFGVSNFSAAQMKLLRASLDVPLLVNQIELSLLHPWPIDDGLAVNVAEAPTVRAVSGLLDYCRFEGVRVQAWSPLARGGLSRPLEETKEEHRPAARLVAELADAKGCAREAIVLAWLLRHPAGIQPVIGTTTPERLRACLEADGVELTHEEWYRLLIAARGRPLP